jgi:hypothetical protein
MRNISFALTESQFLDQSKDVTRRLGWKFLKAEDRLMGCRKCQGIKPGESIVRLGPIEIISVRFELLEAMLVNPLYGQEECRREGFPEMTPMEFVEMFRRHMTAPPGTTVTRIEFKHIEPLRQRALVGSSVSA